MLPGLFAAALPFGLTLFLATAAGQSTIPEVSVPATCEDGYSPGSDTVLLTVPYTPSQVLNVVGDFQNLTWSGNDPSTVTLNGTNNQVGTARTYTLQGLTVIETLDEYYRPNLNCLGSPFVPQYPQYPPDMAYFEAHSFANTTFNGDQVYMPFDGLSVTSQCLGNASLLNYTASFCATDVPTTQSLLHSLHQQDLMNVQAMLGNNTYTSCAGLWNARHLLANPIQAICANPPSATQRC